MSNDPHGQTNQPLPKVNEHPAVYDLLIADMRSRDAYGQKKYGVRLQPFNGRDSLRDAYEEVLDLAVYLRQLVYEQSSPNEAVALERKACAEMLRDASSQYTVGSDRHLALTAAAQMIEARFGL